MPRGRKSTAVVNEDQVMIAQQAQDFAIEVEIKSTPLGFSCLYCARSFNTKVGLKVHARSCNTRTNNQTERIDRVDQLLTINKVEIKSTPLGFSCLYCARSFNTKFGLKVHARYCNTRTNNQTERIDRVDQLLTINKPTFKCTECSKNFTYEKSFKAHMKEMHSKLANSVECDKCSVRCPSKKVLMKHMESHEATKTQCTFCGQTFSRRYHLARHLNQKGCNGIQPAAFVCQVCQQTFSRKDNLIIHLRWHISKSLSDYMCGLCGLHSRSLASLVRHRMKEHEGNRFQCNECGNVVKGRVAFIKHLNVHGERIHACDKCNFRCKSVEILRRHALRHSAQKPFQCLLCSRSFIQSHELTAHTFRHTGHSSIVCQHCGECFSSRITLKSHIARMHDGTRGLYCTVEGCRGSKRPFLNEISLRMHMKSHETNKPFKCGKCEKTFHIKAALLSHALTHQWERARRCVYCPRGRAYIRGDLLLRHLRIKHAQHFDDNLKRVRRVLGVDPESFSKMTKEESAQMINLLDALVDKSELTLPALDDDQDDPEQSNDVQETGELKEWSAVMGEEELVDNIKKMMVRLIDKETLECLGWPDSGVDQVLESVLQQCSVRVAESHAFSRVACLRENAKQLFLRVIEDDTITRMLNTKTIDAVIRHVVNASE